MAILNYSSITKAIEDILRQRLPGYVITRNERKNVDPNICLMAGTGWIGIYRGSIDYDAYVISSRPWNVTPAPLINVQVASELSGNDCEDRLQTAEKAVVDALENDRTLNNTVSMILGYSMDYEYNQIEEIYFHGVNIRVKAETRS